jgi:hypothetical protein
LLSRRRAFGVRLSRTLPVGGIRLALHQIDLGQPVNQFDGRVGLQQQPLGEIADRDRRRIGDTEDDQQGLVLLRSQPDPRAAEPLNSRNCRRAWRNSASAR